MDDQTKAKFFSRFFTKTPESKAIFVMVVVILVVFTLPFFLRDFIRFMKSFAEGSTISIISPGDGATVSGMVSISASVSDSSTLSAVQFQLDGTDLGSQVSSSPYETILDTTTVSTGTHTVIAVAYDVSGEIVGLSTITINVPSQNIDDSELNIERAP